MKLPNFDLNFAENFWVVDFVVPRFPKEKGPPECAQKPTAVRRLHPEICSENSPRVSAEAFFSTKVHSCHGKALQGVLLLKGCTPCGAVAVYVWISPYTPNSV